ncbi:MAG: transposase [Thermodesulfobacteriota bacterium]
MTRSEDTLMWYKRIKHFNLPGHVHFLTFSCYRRLPLLTNELWCSWLAESISRAVEKHNTALWAYVFMPDHVHLLVRPRNETYDISAFLRSVKISIGKRILSALRKSGSPLLLQLRGRERPADSQLRFWQAGPGYDKNIWTLEKAVEKANYCHRNPVARGLVTSPSDWKWSSYLALELGYDEIEVLPVDPWQE